MIDGSVSEPTRFFKHQIAVQGLDGRGKSKLILRERPTIGGIPPRAEIGQWVNELKHHSIKIPDHKGAHNSRPEIDNLIGGDYREQLMTGRRVQLKEDVYAVESVFGWMVCGPVIKNNLCSTEVVIQSYLTGDITQLWNLDTLGIRDSVETCSSDERNARVKEVFQQSVTRVDGRYVVKLPWINEQVRSHLPSNKNVCVKRLENATVKLDKQEKFQTYNDIFKAWLEEGIVEVPSVVDTEGGHYLPHRPVFKDSATTPVRPVFDASCHVSKSPSLNQCLEKGPNWLKLIPAILLRFRQKKIGTISDIRKAFQVIGVAPEDRKFQKFLWWNEDSDRKLQPYQHCRVVFGLTCSPFILAAILELHLSAVKPQWKETAEVLKRSLYVDNFVASFDLEGDYFKFKEEAVEIMLEAKMDLRQWETQLGPPQDTATKVLGLKWDKVEDALYCQVPKDPELEKVSKRKVLSLVAQIFEPIGYACPVLLQPKLMLQEAWATDLGWDDEWEDERRQEFLAWYEQVSVLEKIKIPRNAFGHGTATPKIQFHAFCDASQLAYAAVVFARVQRYTTVTVQLIAAKSRVAPLDKKRFQRVTIPRLELLGCLVGARLCQASRTALNLESAETFFWTDSTAALLWIQREGDWGTFVGNRVAEIFKLTGASNWRHVPGQMNPADLPSRGCSPEQLILSKWWDGPGWLKNLEPDWPVSQAHVDQSLVDAERRKTSLVATEVEVVIPRFSSYLKNIRVAAWVRRFLFNCRTASKSRLKTAGFSKQEMMAAEADVIKSVQLRYFGRKPAQKNFEIGKGQDGLLHVKSRLMYKTDSESFKRPILLPKEDPLVLQLIQHIHRSNCHAGTQFTLGKIRERYWIQQGRKTVAKVIHCCTVCKRHRSKCLATDTAPLPKERVETVFAFQTTGCDLAGPLLLKGGTKAWIVLFTCAVYRGVHLDLITSLSTEAFLAALERFINLVGRPHRIYSDNGTNFVGASNLMKLLDWKKVEAEFEQKEIKWTFNPPAAPWWGGWWERLVRSTKELLRRMLGTAKLSYEQLLTCLAAVAGTINDRPLTTLTEDEGDLQPLTPRMFMRDLPISGFPEGDEIGAEYLRGAYKKLQVLKQALKARFRKEYLALLVQKSAEKPTKVPKVGDVVLIGLDNKKRFEWPLGRIVELGIGKDGKLRVAKVKVGTRSLDPKEFSTSFLTRPLQRLYPLEMSSWDEVKAEVSADVLERIESAETVQPNNEKKTPSVTVKTRSGRIVQKPLRFGNWNSSKIV